MYPTGVVVLGLLTAWFAHDGWTNDPGRDVFFIWFNRIGAILCPLGIVCCVLCAVRVWRESILLDETGSSVNNGEPIPRSAITEIDDSTYDDDRYVRVTHKDAGGRERTLALDAQKMDGVDEFLDELFDLTKLPSKAAAKTRPAPRNVEPPADNP
jgi:hypothetical protein